MAKRPPKPRPAIEHRVELMPLDDVQPAKRNPKLHADKVIRDSVDRFGYVELMTMDERTGRLVAGHGRRDAFVELRTKGKEPPNGVKVMDGKWMVPVLRGWSSKNDREAEAYLLASNQTPAAGGWDNEELAKMLGGWDEADLVGIGFSNADLEFMKPVGLEQRHLDEFDVTAPPSRPVWIMVAAPEDVASKIEDILRRKFSTDPRVRIEKSAANWWTNRP